MSYLQQFTKTLPTLLTAFILAVAVWISAETSNNPTEEANFPQPVPLEVVGQDPGLVITSSMPSSVVLTIRAPQSVWQALRANPGLVRAVLDLSGLETGTHTVQVQIQVGRSPYEIVNHSPRSVNVTLERLISRTLPIDLVVRGEPAIGYQAETPELSHDTVIVSGPETLVNQVQSVRALLDLSGATEPITRNITLQALDSSELVVNGISITPDRITAAVEVAQRFGYRNVVVKAEVIGQIANGYRLTNISVFPPAVTVYSPNPQIISSLPGVISTLPVDLTGVQDDIDISVALDLPPGVLVVGDENEVLVRVGVAAIEFLPDPGQHARGGGRTAGQPGRSGCSGDRHGYLLRAGSAAGPAEPGEHPRVRRDRRTQSGYFPGDPAGGGGHPGRGGTIGDTEFSGSGHQSGHGSDTII